MVLVQKWPFLNLFPLGNIGQGLTHRFGIKMAIFRTFFLGKIGQKNVFYDILEQKTPF